MFLRTGSICSGLEETFVDNPASGKNSWTMGTQGPGRKRIPNREKLVAEDDALNQIAREVWLIDTFIDNWICLISVYCWLHMGQMSRIRLSHTAGKNNCRNWFCTEQGRTELWGGPGATPPPPHNHHRNKQSSVIHVNQVNACDKY